jgi:hypothetical protein
VKKIILSKTLFFGAMVFFCFFFFSTASAQTVIFSDNFGSSYTTLASHVPSTTGTGYTLLINNGVLITVQSYNNHATVTANTSNAGSFYTAEGTYPDADYEISSTVNFSGGDSNYTRSMGLRVQDANNMYLLRYGASTMIMYKRVSGVWSTIGTASGVSLAGNITSPYIGETVSFSAVGTTLTAKVNGVTKLTVTDSSITATGKAGIGLGYVNIATDDAGTGVGIDNVVVQTATLDLTAPTITNVSSDKSNGSYKAGEVIDIDVTFSEAVTSAGNVTVTLETGATDRACTFTVTNASTGTCNYTVQAGDTTSDLTVLTISGTIADGASNAMVDFAPVTNLAANKALVIDTTAPGIVEFGATPSETTAVVTWQTNEDSSSIVDYDVSNAFGTSTVETDTSPRVTSHSVSLSGLVACTTYFFQVRSRDAALNSVSNSSFFTTSGCSGGANILSSNLGFIENATGGTRSLLDSGIGISLVIPVGTVGADASFQIKSLNQTTAFLASGTPSGKTKAGNYAFELKALTDVSTAVTSFLEPIQVTLTYEDADVVGIDESTLLIYRWDGATWTALSSCVVDAGANSVTCTTTNFSLFSLFGTVISAATPSSVNGVVPVEFLQALSDRLRKEEDARQVLTQETIQTKVCPVMPTLKKTLKVKTVDTNVKVLQQILNCKGYTVSVSGAGSIGNETTLYGAKTKDAVMNFQKAYNLKMDGMVGKQTVEILNK